jgi:hypothetical protein
MKNKLLFIMCFPLIFDYYKIEEYELNRKDTVMVEKYNFNICDGGNKDTTIIRGETIIEIWKMKDDGGYYKEYAPASDCYTIYKRFYPNGVLAEKGSFFGTAVKFGIWEYYDKDEKLIKMVDEDRKFGKIKPRWILSFLEKEGWFNRKTGINKVTNIPKLEVDGNFTREINRWVVILFFPSNDKNSHSKWMVIVNPNMQNGWTETTYTINGNTGEFDKVEKDCFPME